VATDTAVLRTALAALLLGALCACAPLPTNLRTELDCVTSNEPDNFGNEPCARRH
jgi:hypothetical protein